MIFARGFDLDFVLSVLITAMVCFTAAVLGANRFGFIMNRVHAGGVGDTLGLFLIALSIILGDGFHMGELKLCFIIIFMWFTSPVSSHSDSG